MDVAEMSLPRAPFEREKQMLAQVRARLADIPDDELADAGELAGEMAEFYASFNKDCQHELLARMAVQDRGFVITTNWRADRTTTPKYEYLDEGRRVRAVVESIVGPNEADRYVTYVPPRPAEGTYKPNTQQIKGLMDKVSETEREALASTFIRHEANPKVVFTRIGGME